MCGIVGYIGRKAAADVLLSGLEKLEYRGYDSAGIAVIENDGIRIAKSEGRLQNLRDKISNDTPFTGSCGIGHTRWATHGMPSDRNSHPHHSRKVTVVHNGIIENYIELKNFLIEKGYAFLSETDTETVAHLIDYFYNGDPFEAIKLALEMLKGSYALGILFNDSPETIYAVRKDSPLIIGIGEDENFIASDVPAILKYTDRYYLLEEKEIALLKREKVEVFDLSHNKQDKKENKVTWSVESAEKGGYAHFMLKEIHEQPQAIKNTVLPRTKNFLPDFSRDNIPDSLFSDCKQIIFVACGTALHAGMIGKYVIESVARVPVQVEVASEFRYKNPIVGKDDLVVIISQSGETADTLAALRLAKEKRAKTLAIVNVVGSSIAREADYVLYTWAGPEIAVASTKAYSVQMSVIYLIALKTAMIRGLLSEEETKTYHKELLSIPEKIEKVLKNEEIITTVAKNISSSSSIFYLGRGLDYASAMEGSLKLKEISYIHSESYASGELKHGTIALISEGTPVIALATQNDLLEKTISNIKEVKCRGAMVTCIARSAMPYESGLYDNMITLPEISDLLAPMLSIIPLQLIAYYTATYKGCDVDKPRNLAKSVTVE